MKPLVVIPARGGSKGVPRKNIKILGGKPLIHWTIEAALEVFRNIEILVSTDDEEIKQVVERTGVKAPFLRPTELSTDTAGSYEVLLHALNFVEKNGGIPDTLILLQPTSPFRTASHIREALELYKVDTSLDMVVSVCESKSNPFYVSKVENESGWLKPLMNTKITRRQDAPKVYEYNGAIYIINIEKLKQMHISEFEKVRKYVMDEQSSIDIDTPLDWDFATYLFNKNNHE